MVTSTPRRLGFRNSTVGWLTAAGLGWIAGYAAFVSDWDVPYIGEIRPLVDIGWVNWLLGGLLLLAAVGHALWPRKPGDPSRIGNRWAAPAMVTCAVLGLLWIVIFYTLGSVTLTDVPVLTDVITYLGNYNIVIGMGFILAAFGFATKWE